MSPVRWDGFEELESPYDVDEWDESPPPVPVLYPRGRDQVRTYSSQRTRSEPRESYSQKRVGIASQGGEGERRRGQLPRDRPWVFRKKNAVTKGVNMINAEGAGDPLALLALFNPMLNKVLTQLQAPKFSGKPEDWQRFRRDCRGYIL